MSGTELFVLPDHEVTQLLAENDLSIDSLLQPLGGHQRPHALGRQS